MSRIIQDEATQMKRHESLTTKLICGRAGAINAFEDWWAKIEYSNSLALEFKVAFGDNKAFCTP